MVKDSDVLSEAMKPDLTEAEDPLVDGWDKIRTTGDIVAS